MLLFRAINSEERYKRSMARTLTVANGNEVVKRVLFDIVESVGARIWCCSIYAAVSQPPASNDPMTMELVTFFQEAAIPCSHASLHI